jgi:hypothetical protein
MERRFIFFVAASALFVAGVLLIDRDGLVQQAALGSAAAGFLWLFARRSGVERRQIVCAIIIASIGEIVLSLGWGLYTYRHALIPLYVPPGHGLVYTLAAGTARQERLRRRAATLTCIVLVSGSAVALGSLVLRRDVWGALWWIGALVLIGRSRDQLLLSACLVFTIALEWSGTAIGNWRWAADVPFVGLRSANPPAGVGILYILLDLIVVAITSRIGAASDRAAVSGRDPIARATRVDRAAYLVRPAQDPLPCHPII